MTTAEALDAVSGCVYGWTSTAPSGTVSDTVYGTEVNITFTETGWHSLALTKNCGCVGGGWRVGSWAEDGGWGRGWRMEAGAGSGAQLVRAGETKGGGGGGYKGPPGDPPRRPRPSTPPPPLFLPPLASARRTRIRPRPTRS